VTDKQIEIIREFLVICGEPCDCDADHVCDRCIKMNRVRISIDTATTENNIQNPKELIETIFTQCFVPCHSFTGMPAMKFKKAIALVLDRDAKRDKQIRIECADIVRNTPCVNGNETEVRKEDAIAAILSYMKEWKDVRNDD